MQVELSKTDMAIAIEALRFYSMRAIRKCANSNSNSEAWNAGMARDADDARRKLERLLCQAT